MKKFLSVLFLLPSIFLFSEIPSNHIQPYLTPIYNFVKTDPFLTEYPSGLQNVDSLYVINLDKRQEKWKRTDLLFKRWGLRANRFSAVNGWDLSHQDRLDLFGPYPLRMSPGHTGCLLSHVSVLMHAKKKGHNVVWVTEDDIEIIDNVRKISELISNLNKIDPDWDIFYTDMDSKDPKGNTVPSVSFDFRPDQEHLPFNHYLTRTNMNKDIMKVGQRFGMYSYLVSKKGIEKILNYYTHVFIWSPFDVDTHYIPSIREYSVRKDIVSVWWQCDISDTCRPLINYSPES